MGAIFECGSRRAAAGAGAARFSPQPRSFAEAGRRRSSKVAARRAVRGSSAGRGAGGSPQGRWSSGRGGGEAVAPSGRFAGQGVLRGKAAGRRALPRALFFPFPPCPEGGKGGGSPSLRVRAAGKGGWGGCLPEGPGLPGGRSVPAPVGPGGRLVRPGWCRRMGLRKGRMREGLLQPKGKPEVSRCGLTDLWGP